jgi:hypothetical protein
MLQLPHSRRALRRSPKDTPLAPGDVQLLESFKVGNGWNKALALHASANV